MTTLLKNCRIINPFGSPAFIKNGYILIQAGIILEIGDGPGKKINGDVRDLKGRTILPGMINAHSHLYSALAAGMPFPRGNPGNFKEILEQVWWILDLALDFGSTKAAFEAGLLDHLRQGVTTVIDHHSSPNYCAGSLNLLADTARRFGMRISAAFEITDRNGRDKFAEGLEENIKFMQQFGNHEFIRPLIGLHASFTLSDDSLGQIKDALRQEKDWGIHIHAAEDKADQEDAVQRGYASPVQRLDSFGLLNANSLLIHGVHLVPEDEKILKDRGTMLVHNPSSNASNQVGLTSSELLNSLKAGLGTDGMQGNLLKEAKEGTLIRSSHLKGGVDYLKLLFKNNPKIASKIFSAKIGRLEKGYSADLAIFDYYPRTILNDRNWQGHVLFGLDKPCHVMTAGIFRIFDNKFTEISPGEILDRAGIQAAGLWKKMEEIEEKK